MGDIMKLGLFLAALCLGLIGCTSTEALGDRAIEYNKELEQSTNVTLLTNVVRASERVPMSFSRLGSMSYTGSLGLTPSTSFGIGAGSGEDNDTIGLSVQSNDSGVTPLEALTSQKYYQAITASIDPETVAFYRDRGWRDALLYSLFIEKIFMEQDFLAAANEEEAECLEFEKLGFSSLIECRAMAFNPETLTENGKVYHVFDNDPDSVHKFARFHKISEIVIKDYDVNLEAVTPKGVEAYYPAPFCGWDTVGEQIKFEAPFTLKDCERLTGFEPMMTTAGLNGLDFSKLPADIRILHGVAFKKQKNSKVLKFTKKSKPAGSAFEPGCTGEGASGDETQCKIRIILRSPKDMVYFLGELLRAQSEKQNEYKSMCASEGVTISKFRFGYKALCPTDKDPSLFYLGSEEMSLTNRGIDLQNERMFPFEYNGQRYWVPTDDTLRGRTMQLVALLNELFFLNQEASEAPVVSVIQGATIQ